MLPLEVTLRELCVWVPMFYFYEVLCQTLPISLTFGLEGMS
jgi:hypothetical protein